MGASLYELFLIFLAANLATVIIVYSFVLYSRGERRRAVNVFLAGTLTLVSGLGTLHMFFVASSPAFFIMAGAFATSVGFVWLLSDMTGLTDLEPQRRDGARR